MSAITLNEIINIGGFISRKKAKNMNVYYPMRYEEKFYQDFDIYDDIFFYICDYHRLFKTPNYFGNVELVLSIEILKDDNINSVAITKNNPLYWNKYSNIKYFETLQEYIEYFYNSINNHKANQRIFFCFKHCENIVPFKSYLKSIILDNPCRKVNSKDVFKNSFNILLKTLRKNNLKVELKERECTLDCLCKIIYRDMEMNKLLKLYYVK